MANDFHYTIAPIYYNCAITLQLHVFVKYEGRVNNLIRCVNVAASDILHRSGYGSDSSHLNHLR